MQHGSASPAPAAAANAMAPVHSRTRTRPSEEGSAAIHATVSLPGRPVRAAMAAPPVVAGGRPPLPPPRPQSSISALTRDLPSPRPERRQPQQPSPAARPAPSLLQPILPSSSSPSSPPPTAISLTAPRPGMDRSQNLYVDAPLLLPQQQQSAAGQASGGVGSNLSRVGSTRSSLGKSSSSSSQKKQPSSTSVIESSSTATLAQKKRPPPPVPGSKLDAADIGKGGGLAGDLSDFPSLSLRGTGANTSMSDDSSSSGSELEDSIICHACGRCRCEECARPRKLPQKWLCGNKCLFSADTVVDTLSCMWLVKAVMYHCAMEEDDDEEPSGFEKPCSCSQPGALARWACMGAASVVLPCLCCYPVMKGGQRCVEALHRRATSVGCKCEASSPRRGVSVITTAPGPTVAAPVPRSSPGGDSAKSLLG